MNNAFRQELIRNNSQKMNFWNCLPDTVMGARNLTGLQGEA